MAVVGIGTMLLFRPFLATTWLDRFIARLPGEIRSFLGITALATPAQFLDGVVFGFFAPVVFMTFGIGVGSRAIAGEQEDGTLASVLATPIGRPDLVVVKVAALTVGAALIGVGTWVGIMIGGRAADVALDPGNVTLGIVADLMLGVGMGAVALLAGVITGRLGLAAWIATAVALAADGLHGIAATVPQLSGLRYASLLYYADGEPATRGITPAHELALLVVIVALTAVGGLALERQVPPSSPDPARLASDPSPPSPDPAPHGG
ncbi:MAG TPA: ABC transporter permease subunit [Candidatus Saccharimonadales bacterium]|nr:ABC transporter permease subunit [Candidatus Saccharimonadales bacterium]